MYNYEGQLIITINKIEHFFYTFGIKEQKEPSHIFTKLIWLTWLYGTLYSRILKQFNAYAVNTTLATSWFPPMLKPWSNIRGEWINLRIFHLVISQLLVIPFMNRVHNSMGSISLLKLVIYIYIGWSKKMAHFLMRYKFQSELHSTMKLHTKQLQRV